MGFIEWLEAWKGNPTEETNGMLVGLVAQREATRVHLDGDTMRGDLTLPATRRSCSCKLPTASKTLFPRLLNALQCTKFLGSDQCRANSSEL